MLVELADVAGVQPAVGVDGGRGGVVVLEVACENGRRTGEDLALVYNDWTLSATGADGNPIERSGKAIEVVRRQPDGSWRFAIDDPTARG